MARVLNAPHCLQASIDTTKSVEAPACAAVIVSSGGAATVVTADAGVVALLEVFLTAAVATLALVALAVAGAAFAERVTLAIVRGGTLRTKE